MGCYDYPKDLTSAYDLDINWKGNTAYVAVPPNYWVAFLTDDRVQDGNVHATYLSVILTRARKPVECHICQMSHYSSRFSDSDKSDTSGNK